jgi:hypothetical protein
MTENCKYKKHTYYKFRLYKIDHFNSYAMAHLKEEYINKILAVLQYDYKDINCLRKIIHFTDEEIKFLQFYRLSFQSIDEFKINIPTIVNNLKEHTLISSDNFELNEKGEFII